VHEIKHDGYRLMARRDALSVGIRLLTRNGHDWASRYPLILQAVRRLKVRSCLIDGEAVCCNDRGVSSFDKLRHRSHDPEVFLVAFDLLELNGDDLRREPLEVRKQTLASLPRGSLPGVQFNAHLTHPGDIVFHHACKMPGGHLGSDWARAVALVSRDWLKFKKSEAPAVKREAEEDWGRSWR
jgi:ATP-dependent DNA ligase